jgi:hypothetical protein
MERKMTKLLIECPKPMARTASHVHGPTPAEIQRWEDDGGAILPDPPPRHAERHHRDDAELAAA